jgi:ROK family
VETDRDARPETYRDTIVGLIEELGEGRHSLNYDTLKGFSSFPLRDRLAVRLGSPVNVTNDATAAAWIEFSVCAAEEQVDSLLYVTVSTGVGGGIVPNRRPLISADGLTEGYIAMIEQHLDEEPALFRPRVIAARLGADSALFGVTIPENNA